MTVEVILTCQHCNKSGFKQKFGLTNHENACKNKVHVFKELTCPSCKRSDFSSRSGLSLHIKNCSPDSYVPAAKFKTDTKTGNIINETPLRCKCPMALKHVLGCSLGLECWIDGWGWCTYAVISKKDVQILDAKQEVDEDTEIVIDA